VGGLRDVIDVIGVENKLEHKLYMAGITVVDMRSDTMQ
jgi:hypothetical protein